MGYLSPVLRECCVGSSRFESETDHPLEAPTVEQLQELVVVPAEAQVADVVLRHPVFRVQRPEGADNFPSHRHLGSSFGHAVKASMENVRPQFLLDDFLDARDESHHIAFSVCYRRQAAGRHLSSHFVSNELDERIVVLWFVIRHVDLFSRPTGSNSKYYSLPTILQNKSKTAQQSCAGNM